MIDYKTDHIYSVCESEGIDHDGTSEPGPGPGIPGTRGRSAPFAAQRDRGLPGEHPGRSKDPLVKVAGLAWLEFEKPDLDAAERFGTDFGFTVADRTPQTLLLRGRWAGPACLVVRRGPSLPLRRHRLPGRRPR